MAAKESLLPDRASRNFEKSPSIISCNTSETSESNCNETIYTIGDSVFSLFVVAPLVVTMWRSTWNLMNLHEVYFPFAQTFLIGIVVHICFALVRALLLSRSLGAWSDSNGGAGRWLRERFLSKVYTYIFILANLNHWRGGWGLLDAAIEALLPNETDPHRPVLYAAFTIFFYLSTIILRSSKNILASPYFLVTDGKEATYIFTTRFKTMSTRETALYILDCIFSVTVVGSLVVFVWRGSWALLDVFLFPEDPIKSHWLSLVVGYSIAIATFALQAPVRWLTARMHGAPRLLLVDVYHLVSFIATVNVWRGFWGILDIYFFPDRPKLSNWSLHIASMMLMILLNCSNTVLVRGVYIDAEEPAGECVIFPCHYIRLYFHKERTKKRHKRALAAAATKKPDDTSMPLQNPVEKV